MNFSFSTVINDINDFNFTAKNCFKIQRHFKFTTNLNFLKECFTWPVGSDIREFM